MKAITFNANILKYLSSVTLGKVNKNFYLGKTSCTSINEIPEPVLPGNNWVKIKTQMGGICGSDLNVLYLNDSPANTPFVSFPFVFGHEAMGEIVQAGSNVSDYTVGQRVVINPLLSCEYRGVSLPCENCEKGLISLCNNFAEGQLSPGMMTGYCSETGGSWGEYFVAHYSQLYPVPADISNEEIVLTDPLASALQPVLANLPKDNEHILVMGVGIIGLLLVAAIRALGIKCKISVMAKYPFQGEMAKKYGADKVIYTGKNVFSELAEDTSSKLYSPIIGKKVAIGGYDKIFDCVASDYTLDTALRFTKARGEIILVGLAAIPKTVDWSQIWFRELSVKGTFCYSKVNYKGQMVDSFNEAYKMIIHKKIDVKPLISHKFPLSEYKQAVNTASGKRKHQSIKVVFEF